MDAHGTEAGVSHALAHGLLIVVRMHVAAQKQISGHDPGSATLRLVLGKFATPEVASVVLADPKGYWKTGARRTVTTMFVDVRGFTSFAAHVSPEEAVATINDIFGVLCDVVVQEEGIVNHFMGDGMLAVFGAPFVRDDHAVAAARAALEARASVERLAVARQRVGQEPLRVGIGLNTGSVVAGCIGTAQRTAYTVIGHAVNVASRLVALADPGEILLGAETAMLVRRTMAVEDEGLVDLKGIGPLPVYRLGHEVAAHAKSPRR